MWCALILAARSSDNEVTLSMRCGGLAGKRRAIHRLRILARLHAHQNPGFPLTRRTPPKGPLRAHTSQSTRAKSWKSDSTAKAVRAYREAHTVFQRPREKHRDRHNLGDGLSRTPLGRRTQEARSAVGNQEPRRTAKPNQSAPANRLRGHGPCSTPAPHPSPPPLQGKEPSPDTAMRLRAPRHLLPASAVLPPCKCRGACTVAEVGRC